MHCRGAIASPARSSLLLMLLLLLSGCSGVQLAYNNLDRLVVWRATDYVDLERDQKRWLRAAVTDFTDWQRQAQLADWSRWLLQVDQCVQGDLSTEALVSLEREAREQVDVMLRRMLPAMTALLRDLSDEQIDELRHSLAENNRELNEPYQGLDLDERQARWRERVRDGLDDWIGRLTSHQREALRAASEQLDPDNSAWIASRERWQEALFAALEQRQQPGPLERALVPLVLEPERWHTEGYVQQLKARQEVYRVFTLELANSLSNRQQRELSQRLRGWAEDLSELAVVSDEEGRRDAPALNPVLSPAGPC